MKASYFIKWICLPLLLLCLTNCSGDLSLNSEQIQEIVAGQPEGSFDVIVGGCVGFGFDPPFYAIKVYKSEIDAEMEQLLSEGGFKLRRSGNLAEYTWEPESEPDECRENDFLLNQVDPNDIEAIEVLTKDPEVAPYGDKVKNGVVIITFKKGTAQIFFKAG